MIDDLKDTVYSSYWNADIGKVRDPVPGLPAGMNPLEVTFGNPSKKGSSDSTSINLSVFYISNGSSQIFPSKRW